MRLHCQLMDGSNATKIFILVMKLASLILESLKWHRKNRYSCFIGIAINPFSDTTLESS